MFDNLIDSAVDKSATGIFQCQKFCLYRDDLGSNGKENGDQGKLIILIMQKSAWRKVYIKTALLVVTSAGSVAMFKGISSELKS